MKRRADLLAAIFLFLVALFFCGRAVFTGRVLMPLDMLLLMSPWNAHIQQVAPGFMIPQNPMLDPVQQYYPWRIFAVDSLKSGIIPLWNPYAYCGQPFLANLQSALFYPLNLIFLILPIGAAFTWGAVIHLFLAGLLMYLLLRQWRLHPLAGVFGAVAFMLNGYIIGWLEYPAFGQWVIIWLPAVLLCYEKSLDSNRWLWSALTGVAIGIQFLGGQLQISGYIILTFLLYVLWRALAVKDRKEMALRITSAAIALLLGVALAAQQLLPSLELAPLSARKPQTLAEAQKAALPLTHLILYLIPNFFGNPKFPESGQIFEHVGYWGDLPGKYSINFFETGCYVGIPTLLLAWLSLRLWRKPQVSFLIALTVVSVLLALGSPLFSLLFSIGPGMKQLSGLARVLSIAAFGLAGLAAFGLDRLIHLKALAQRSGQPHRAASTTARQEKVPEQDSNIVRWWEILSFVFLSLLAVLLAWMTFSNIILQNPLLPENFQAQTRRFAFFFLLSIISVWLLARQHSGTKPQKEQVSVQPPMRYMILASILLLLLLADLFSFGYRFNPATDPKLAYFPTRTTDFLQEHAGHDRVAPYRSVSENPQAALRWMLPNTPTAYKLRDIHGYDSLVPGRYIQLVGFTDWGEQGKWPAPDSPLADMLAVKYALTSDEIHAPGWELVESAETNIYRNTEALPRAYVATRVRWADEQQCLSALKAGNFNPRAETLLAGNALSEANKQAEGTVEFLRDGINTIELTAALSTDGYVVLTDTAYPGWQATVDGKQTPWELANYTFRAVPVPAGRHRVQWQYEPATLKIGLFMSLAALALVSGFFIRLKIQPHQ